MENHSHHSHECACEHSHDSSNKYLDMLSLYNTAVNDAEVKEAVRKIITQQVH